MKKYSPTIEPVDVWTIIYPILDRGLSDDEQALELEETCCYIKDNFQLTFTVLVQLAYISVYIKFLKGEYV